jgi:hypothetical protein
VKKRIVAAAALALAFVCLEISAHPGGLNAQGCHNNRKTGDYHCHRAQAEPSESNDVRRAVGSSSSGPVKMSKSGICHDRSSPWYGRTKNFTPYQSMNACIRAGGRPPKS